MNGLAFKVAWRLLLYPLLALAALAFFFFWLYAHPRRHIGSYTPEDFGLKAEPLRLRTSDGIELDAWFIPHKTSRSTVIICHGYPMDKSDVLGLTSFLAREFNLLYFDFRATGRSGGFFSTGGARETRDIDAAAAFASGRLPGGAIGLFGFSMGGAAVLLSDNPAVKARALDAPFADLHGELEHIFAGWGPLRRPLLLMMRGWMLLFTGVDIRAVSPVGNAAAFAAPMLLVHGTLDGTVPPSNSAAIKAANPAAELWLVEGADHGQNHYTAPAEYERRLAAFFRSSL